MKKIASPLFQDLSEAELDTLAAAGHLRTRQFAKHEVIFRAGSCVREIGIVLRGSVHIENLDLWGTKSILSSVGAGQAFAETYAFCGEALMVDAVAAEHCEILFLHTAALTDARIEPALQDKLLRRLLAVSMRKNLSLSQRIFCTTPKTVRGRLLTYFSAQAARSGSLQFEIPFNRQQLADYLNLDRSALSKELCRMRDEGLLTFRKNHFVLRQLPELLEICRELGFRATLTTNGTLLPKKQEALLAAPALRKVSVSLHSFEANEAGDFSAYLTGCTAFAHAAQKAGVLADFRLWNLDGAQTKGLHDRNAEILERLHAAFPGVWKKNTWGWRLGNGGFVGSPF